MAPHYDFAWIEMQHSVLSWADVARLIAACPQAGATPMIRLADEFESTLQHATDVGALGVIEPTVDTVEKAEAVARYARFPPFGRRSQGGNQAGSLWGINGVNYRQEINANMLVVLMIETPTGVANALEIARVPGVDVVLAANSDLGNFSGYQPTDVEYQQLVTRVHDATLAAGKFFGCTNAPEGPTARADEADFRMIQNPPKSHDGYVAPARGGRAGAPATSRSAESCSARCRRTWTTRGRRRRAVGVAINTQQSPRPFCRTRGEASSPAERETITLATAGVSTSRSLVDLEIMDLAFLAPRRHRHAYAFAGVGAAGGTVPAFFIGVDHVAQFAMDHSDAGDQRTDIAVNIDPELHHVGVPVAPVGGRAAVP